MPAANGHPPASPPPRTALALSSFRDDTPIVIDTLEQPLSLTVDDVLRYIAPGAPRHEALAFLLTCKAMKINPFLKEAFLTPAKEKWVTVVAKSGYLRAAQRHESYNGHDAGIVAQPYDKTKVRQGQPPPYTGPPVDCEGSLLPDGYLLVGGWAAVWRKGVDRPITSRVSMAEYDRKQSTWMTIPSTMIRKVALVAALREAFSLSGYDESEMGAASAWVAEAIDAPPIAAATATTTPPDGRVRSEAWVADPSLPKPPAPRTVQVITHEPAVIIHAPPPPERVSPELAARLTGLMDRAGMSTYQRNVALTKRGVDRVEDLDVVAATTMVNKLEATLSREEWDPLAGSKDAGKSRDESEEVSTEVTQEAIGAIAPARERSPGDDDEPFDDATGRVLTDPAEIAAEFDRPIRAGKPRGKEAVDGGLTDEQWKYAEASAAFASINADKPATS